jgi:hypothetical protein
MIKTVQNNFKGIWKDLVRPAIAICFITLSLSATEPFKFNFADDKLVKISKFYPNPASSIINFEFAADVDKSYSLQIYNFTGKRAYETQVNSDKIKVDLSTFYRGIYFFQLRDRSGRIVETGKFQVIR